MKNRIILLLVIVLIFGAFLLFNGTTIFEGLVNVADTKKVYGSNGIAINGYSTDGSPILSFDSNGKPIIGKKADGTPIYGTLPTPSASTSDVNIEEDKNTPITIIRYKF